MSHSEALHRVALGREEDMAIAISIGEVSIEKVGALDKSIKNWSKWGGVDVRGIRMRWVLRR